MPINYPSMQTKVLFMHIYSLMRALNILCLYCLLFMPISHIIIIILFKYSIMSKTNAQFRSKNLFILIKDSIF
jgi:hypothetical protein